MLILALTFRIRTSLKGSNMAQLNFNAVDYEQQSQPAPQPNPALAMLWPKSCTLTDEQKSVFGHTSNFVGVMDTAAKVEEHWFILEGMRADAAKREQKNVLKDPVLLADQIAKRGQQAAITEAARGAWKNAIEARRVAMLAHDEIVRELHAAYNAARGK
jgi:hypothetical protein